MKPLAPYRTATTSIAYLGNFGRTADCNLTPGLWKAGFPGAQPYLTPAGLLPIIKTE